MRLFYNIVIIFYAWAIRLASLKNRKAKLWIEGRENIFEKLKNACQTWDKTIWIHCASLGEFEQGRPLIEALKKHKPEYKILLTFFSPSGYEVRKNYPLADHVSYLPIDTPKNAEKFLTIVRPKYIFFIKYEFWFNYIYTAFKKEIPLYSVSCIFRKNQYFFKWYGGWFRKRLSQISYFFLQDEASKQLLENIKISQCGVFGDTRFDTVASLCSEEISFPMIEKFGKNSPLFIAGSTWLQDEKLLHTIVKKFDYKFIIAPHETDKNHLLQIQSLFDSKHCALYTEINEKTNLEEINVLIINTIGMLRNLYRYGKIAYIGGGFGKGIHNVLEAATYGMPIIFGPNYSKFKEAGDLIQLGGAFTVKNEKELFETVQKLTNDTALLNHTASITKNYIAQQKGATEKIIAFVWK